MLHVYKNNFNGFHWKKKTRPGVSLLLSYFKILILIVVMNLLKAELQIGPPMNTSKLIY